MTVFDTRGTIMARLAGRGRLASPALAAAVALVAAQCAHAAAGAGAVTLHASDASATTLTLRDAGQDPGGRRRFAYALRVTRGACRATLAGVVHQAAQAGAASAMPRDGGSRVTALFHDGAEGRDVTLTIDVGSARPRYAGVVIARAPAACVDWPRLDAEFRAP